MDTQLRRMFDADVLIIGVGPVGLYGAYASSQSGSGRSPRRSTTRQLPSTRT